MPKPRTVDRFFWDDPDVAEQFSRDERLLMIGIWTKLADDEGRLLADPAYVRKEIFGYDEDLTVPQILEMIGKICKIVRTWKLYRVGDHIYIQIDPEVFKKHQDFKYVVHSKLPGPRLDSIESTVNRNLENSENFSRANPTLPNPKSNPNPTQIKTQPERENSNGQAARFAPRRWEEFAGKYPKNRFDEVKAKTAYWFKADSAEAEDEILAGLDAALLGEEWAVRGIIPAASKFINEEKFKLTYPKASDIREVRHGPQTATQRALATVVQKYGGGKDG